MKEIDESRVERQRLEVEERLAEVRTALRSEIGVAPRRRAWLLAVLAGAVGLAVAVGLSGRRRS